jgi:3'(2'), 5'-bisphosphate nucleotidase
MTPGRLIKDMTDAALAAGEAIMAVYACDFAVARKDDASPVTEADARAEEIILQRLAAAAPRVQVLAEESAHDARIDPARDFFLVDPLDGTKEFISRNGEFTVNIALVRAGRPVLGVVYAPALQRLYAGGVGLGAWRIDDIGGLAPARRTIAVRPAPRDGIVAVASRSHRTPETEDLLAAIGVARFAEAGSSLKFCLVAEGAADIYPRLGRTMEWDTAAGQAVLEAAGGCVRVHPSGEPLAYGKSARGFDNPSFIARGGAASAISARP